MKTESLQKQAFQQRRLINRFLKIYAPIEKGDGRLQGFKPITCPFYLRNYSTREQLCNFLCDMRGNRTHYLVRNDERSVIVYGLPILKDPLYNPESTFAKTQPICADDFNEVEVLARQLRNFKAMTRMHPS